ncbi:hypothetical protein DEIPH_ctg004orf0180 [Deinococcus phoenicis]|uniref:Uncharacterized protein n=1 Tax=Deinococcus phoenicis TaxID=1476583 RepID=A0A016QUJ9_9DEIO|nr:hypothetical protein [Deinococcus phoenicis]EYB69651.1 hypothetical protein DEIPH_ctg004orf0180 [Deinococcus phoenicis]
MKAQWRRPGTFCPIFAHADQAPEAWKVRPGPLPVAPPGRPAMRRTLTLLACALGLGTALAVTHVPGTYT